MKPVLLVIIASTRPGRLGLPIANWAISEIEKHGDFEVDVADLALMNLPMLDEPHHPIHRNYTKPHTIAWSKRVDAADAILIVTPEYNYGMPGSLKNALDFLIHEWNYKPVAFISYGGMSGGMRSVMMAKQVVTTLKMVPLPEAVNIHMVPKLHPRRPVRPRGSPRDRPQEGARRTDSLGGCAPHPASDAAGTGLGSYAP